MQLSTQLITAGAMTADITSDGRALERFPYYAVQFVWTGTPVGNVLIQTSIDNATWATVTNSTTAVGGAAGSLLIDYAAPSAVRYVRVKYTFTSGTGTLNAFLFAKSDGSAS